MSNNKNTALSDTGYSEQTFKTNGTDWNTRLEHNEPRV